MCQITHLGRRGESYAGDWLPTIAPSPIRETMHRSFPKEMDRHDIDRVVHAYAEAAWRCQEGGLDGIETLAGGHLIGQFLSPKTNRRTDGFGGSLENRCRFGLMVFEEIRRRIGDRFLVGFRYVVDEADPEGLSFDDCVRAAQIFQSSGCIDFFNAIYGRMDTEVALAVHNMPGMASPIAPWLQPRRRVQARSAAAGISRGTHLRYRHRAPRHPRRSARHGGDDARAYRRPAYRRKIASRAGGAHPALRRRDALPIAVPAALSAQPGHRTGTLARPRHRAAPPAARRVVVVGGGPAGLEAARVSRGARPFRACCSKARRGLAGRCCSARAAVGAAT